jgi:hypothetical protein
LASSGPSGPPSQVSRTARILVIEDEPVIAEIIRVLLEPQGHDVLIADDGSRGFAQAQRQTYFQKPFESEDLIQAVENLVASPAPVGRPRMAYPRFGIGRLGVAAIG